MPVAIKKRLRVIATAQNRSMGGLILFILQEWLSAHGGQEDKEKET